MKYVCVCVLVSGSVLHREANLAKFEDNLIQLYEYLPLRQSKEPIIDKIVDCTTVSIMCKFIEFQCTV